MLTVPTDPSAKEDKRYCMDPRLTERQRASYVGL